MNNKTATILLLSVLLLGLGYYMLRPDYNWEEKYVQNTDNPFDTKVIFRMLENYFEDESTSVLEHKIAFDLPTMPDAPHSNYVFIGNRMYIDSLDAKTLLYFVELGNTAFISANAFPFALNAVLECQDREHIALEEVYLNFYHGDLQKTDGWKCYGRDKDFIEYKSWTYFEEFLFCHGEEPGFLALGHIGTDLNNYIRLDHGAGHFYLHTTPMMFTNLHLLQDENEGYAARVFSHLKPGHIYRDKASTIRKPGDPFPGPGGNRAGTNPLQYVLAQESMAWAWYILLGTGLLYLLFYTKRRQRIIPVTEKNENLSLEFITTIGKLHYVNNNHLQLAREKIKLFKLFIRERYHLSFKIADEDFFETLAMRSEIDIESIKKMFFFASNVESSHSLTDKALMDLHKAFDNFYKNCK